MRKLVVVTLMLGYILPSNIHAENPFLEGLESSRRRAITRAEYQRKTATCESYIIGVAQAEMEASGTVSNMIQKGMDLIESGKGKYSDLCGIMDAHRMVLSSQAAIASNRLLETRIESQWIEEAQETHGGRMEVRLKDGTRVDLLTDTHAIEVEWASNWKEAIGRSLHYAQLTDKKAGIILIAEVGDVNFERSLKYFNRLNSIIYTYNLPIEILHSTRK